MRLAHFGTFDVRNYGDLLFPRLMEWRMSDLFEEIVHISPVGGSAGYRDVRPSRSLSEVTREKIKFDAVVVGGGNILHSNGSTLDEYRQVRETAYSRLWLGAAQLASRQDIPLAINASGVPKRFGRLGQPLVRQLGQRADYFAVRDEYSKDNLSTAGVENVRVVPDTALELARWFGPSAPSLLDVPRELERALDSRFLAVHVNDRYFDGSAAELAPVLDQLAKVAEAKIVLIAIGPCHGDDAYSKEVASHMTSSPIVYSTPKAVEDIAFVISRSVAYVGSSMHGFITATSFHVPALLIAKHASQHKFRGLLAHLGAEDRLVQSWTGAMSRLLEGTGQNIMESVPTDQVTAAIEKHWAAQRAALVGANPRASSFLRHAPDLASVFNARTPLRALSPRTR